MVKVREWATRVRPDFAWNEIITLLILGGLVLLSLYGMILVVSLGRGLEEFIFWVFMGIAAPASIVYFSRLPSRSLRKISRSLRIERSGASVYVFTRSSFSLSQIKSDAKFTKDLAGAGMIVVDDNVLEIRFAESAAEYVYQRDELTNVEEVEIWSRWVWVPQIRISFRDGGCFTGALVDDGVGSGLRVIKRAANGLADDLRPAG